ncbi:hypothetical protein [Ruegeria sp. 6PALISEP08]|uniref:hypothetical protein n=1 Tax=Ruegeria sp. 6PALISEP08 TaxID=1225660 RepID=UPI00067EB31B|nr:hypothetical protein [Ruegeria sp. 6PALISEP08]
MILFRYFIFLTAINLLIIPASLADLLRANGAETARNFAEISVQEDRVQITLEIDLKDMPAFLSEAPEGADPAADLSERVGKALLVSADGLNLLPETQQIEVRQRKTRATSYRPSYGLAQQDERSPQVVFVALEYSFEQRPSAITFTPPLDPDGMPSAPIGVIFDHQGVAVTDYRYLSRPEVFHPNWDDPWYSRFENPNLTRHHKSALMSFISVEPREVRHEVIFRLRDLEGWTDLGLGEMTSLDAELMAQVKTRAIELFSESNPMVIDGTPVKPVVARADQLSLGVDGLKLLGTPDQTDRATAMLGIILSYPRDALPENLSLSWTLFAEDTDAIPVQITDPAGAVPGQITRGSPEISWTNYIVDWSDPVTQPVTVSAITSYKVPAYSIGLLAFALLIAALGVRAGSGRRKVWGVAAVSVCVISGVLKSNTVDLDLPTKSIPNKEAGSNIVHAMVENVAVAQLETQKPEFATALSKFVLPKHSTEVEAEIRRGMTVALPSGAKAQVREVANLTVEDVEANADGNAQVLARWDASVSGGHWGHMHQRVVSYRALLDFEPKEGAWYLSGLTVLAARMNTYPSSQGGNS